MAAGDERPHVGAPSKAARQDFGRAVQPDGEAAAVQQPAVARIDYGTAARGDDPAQLRFRVRRPKRQHRLAFVAAEAGFALRGKDGRHGVARLALHEIVEVDERRSVALRQTASNGGLAAAGEPDEDEVHAATRSRRG